MHPFVRIHPLILQNPSHNQINPASLISDKNTNKSCVIEHRGRDVRSLISFITYFTHGVTGAFLSDHAVHEQTFCCDQLQPAFHSPVGINTEEQQTCEWRHEVLDLLEIHIEASVKAKVEVTVTKQVLRKSDC